jgi:hypothetical protein
MHSCSGRGCGSFSQNYKLFRLSPIFRFCNRFCTDFVVTDFVCPNRSHVVDSLPRRREAIDVMSTFRNNHARESTYALMSWSRLRRPLSKSQIVPSVTGFTSGFNCHRFSRFRFSPSPVFRSPVFRFYHRFYVTGLTSGKALDLSLRSRFGSCHLNPGRERGEVG